MLSYFTRLWLNQVLQERFGQPFRLEKTREGIHLRLNEAPGEILFDRLQFNLRTPSSDLPCAHWDARNEGWESVLGQPLPAPGASELRYRLIESVEGRHIIHYDIPGLVYWMLARVEEIGCRELDVHGRFSSTASHAYRHGYLDRPVVDEWLHVLSQVIRKQWPKIVLKTHAYSVQFSHDVDRPYFFAFMSWKKLTKLLLGDIIKRSDVKLAFRRFLTWLQVKLGDIDVDPFNTFNWLMDVSEANGVKSCFYFICGQTNKKFDADYEIEHPLMRTLLRTIYSRGHEIGLHPSYNCSSNTSEIVKELSRLRSACEEEGIDKLRFGARMHYLRWEQPRTMVALNKAGLTYDSTLIYPDRIGFRCGTCHAFPGFDALNDRPIGLRIIPLIIMDQLLLDECHHSRNKEIISRVFDIRKKVETVGGALTILWHNSSLEEHKELYARIVKVTVPAFDSLTGE